MTAKAMSGEAPRSYDVRVAFSAAEPRDAPLCRRFGESDSPVVETLHEQTAAFAAEGWAKVTREPGVVLLNGPLALSRAITGLVNAFKNESPMVVVDDPAATSSGNEHFAQHTVMASTISRSTLMTSWAALGTTINTACAIADIPPRGPVLIGVDGATSRTVTDHSLSRPSEAGAEALSHATALLAAAERPVVIAGGGVYWSKAEDSLRHFAEGLGIPVVTNGMGRGTIPGDHDLFISRARPLALQDADLIVVAGAPLDFRLGHGRFDKARLLYICEHDSQVARHVELAGTLVGDLGQVFAALLARSGDGLRTKNWVDRLRTEEATRRAAEDADLQADSLPIRPSRLYGELRKRLGRNAIVIGDGGDFVSYAGRYVDTFTPGCFLDPGPFGCLGIGMGYAIAARLAHPSRQVVVLLGDGAAGFSLMEVSTLVRQGLPVVAIIGNNSSWGLEKHHMQAMFGYDVVADLSPNTRYDKVAESMGAKGYFVTEPGEIGVALDDAFAAECPALVNVMLDPADVYPRSTLLA